jgi:hypothetical protein
MAIDVIWACSASGRADARMVMPRLRARIAPTGLRRVKRAYVGSADDSRHQCKSVMLQNAVSKVMGASKSSESFRLSHSDEGQCFGERNAANDRMRRM